MAGAGVIFEVECSLTKPGQAVYVVGGPASLGGWDTAKALALTTGPENFPKWTLDKPVILQAGESVEYKFVMQQASHSGKAVWEEFPGNRKVAAAAAGRLVKASSKWNVAEGTTTSEAALTSDLVPTGPPRASVEAPPTTALLEAVDTAKHIVEEHDAREALRKNFSQSLLCLDIDNDGDDAAANADAPPVNAQHIVEEEPAPAGARPTVSLKHISSFSALTAMADVEEKEEVRKKSTRESTYEPFNLNVPIVIVTSEVAPYSKTGGLGLVAASYSFEFPRKGHRTMVVSPKYRHFDNIHYLSETKVVVNGREEVVKYWHKYESCGDGVGCDYVFIGHDCIERGGGLYNGDDGREYEDNLFRFTLLSMAAMEAPLVLNINGSTYGDKVLFLANDWQAGLVPFHLCHKYRRHGTYQQSRAIYVVHNLGYQGQYPNVNACHFFGCEQHMAEDLKFGNCINLSKAALINADRVLTVSPNYTKEIQTPEGGFRLENFVRAKGDALRLSGILNGIDDVWNPETDKDLHVKYSIDNFVAGKASNKAALQRQLGLVEDPDVVLIGFVGRLTWQKGVDVMVQIVDWLMRDTGNGVTGRCQIVMMGNGEKQYADTLRGAENNYKGRVCGYVGFDPKVEHLLMGGCDLFLMPSRYEPCGLPQMYSQRYGTLPVVHATGGLVDSVQDVSVGPAAATGFHMSPLSRDKMQEVVYRAAELYLKHPEEFRQMQRNAMNMDFYWPQAMDEYERVIDTTLYDPPVAR